MANTDAVIKRLCENIGSLSLELAISAQTVQEERDRSLDQEEEIRSLKEENGNLREQLKRISSVG
jgi:hypothetical protein